MDNHGQQAACRRARPILTTLAVLALFVGGCASSGQRRHGVGTGAAHTDPAVGNASYYASRFDGRPTASGERFDNEKLTAAHRTLPFGTKLRVTNLSNGRSVVVRVNDRGPFVKGRIVDVSLAAARKIDLVRAGVARVRVEQVGGTNGRSFADAR